MINYRKRYALLILCFLLSLVISSAGIAQNAEKG